MYRCYPHYVTLSIINTLPNTIDTTVKTIGGQKRTHAHDAQQDGSCAHDARAQAGSARALQAQQAFDATRARKLGTSNVYSCHGAPRMTLFRVLTSSTPPNTTNLDRKTIHSVASAALEERLVAWARACEEHKFPLITSATLRVKAEKTCHLLLATAAPTDAPKLRALTFSAGWLIKFQRRHLLTSKRMHGEAASVCAAAVQSGPDAVQDAARAYERENVFNKDESACFFCAAPTRSISTHRMAGRKLQKKRLTVALCCNRLDQNVSTLCRRCAAAALLRENVGRAPRVQLRVHEEGMNDDASLCALAREL